MIKKWRDTRFFNFILTFILVIFVILSIVLICLFSPWIIGIPDIIRNNRDLKAFAEQLYQPAMVQISLIDSGYPPAWDIRCH